MICRVGLKKILVLITISEKIADLEIRLSKKEQMLGMEQNVKQSYIGQSVENEGWKTHDI